MNVKVMKLLVIISFLALFGCSKTTPTNTDEPGNNATQSESMDISGLNVGDKVVDPNWEWAFLRGYGYTEFDVTVKQPVVWIVVAKDHYGTGVTLLSEKLIGYFIYDASMLDSGLLAGKNHWGNSGLTSTAGLRPWLNSEAPHEGTGFYNAFSSDFKASIVTTSVPNFDFETLTAYSTEDKVFIPSNTELGDTVHDATYEIGSAWEYFVNAEDDLRVTNFPKQSYGEEYWTRSPTNYGYRTEAVVHDSGFFVNNFADFNNVGVRPALVLNSNTKVSKTPNADGVYEIIY